MGFLMGQEITFSNFDKSNFVSFYQKLKQKTGLLTKMIEQKAFSKRSPVAEFEIKARIVNQNAPCPHQ